MLSASLGVETAPLLEEKSRVHWQEDQIQYKHLPTHLWGAQPSAVEMTVAVRGSAHMAPAGGELT